jgi:hypothetical protein
MPSRTRLLLMLCVCLVPSARAADADDLKALLSKEIVGPRQARLDVEEFVRQRVPRMPKLTSAEAWDRQAARIRADVLDKVIFRGEAARWRQAKLGVEWLETIAGGPGYRIKKLRYEALPGLWIPALLYEPEKLEGKVPAVLNVNGHDRKGKAADYKQIRCINQAKRGMLALNVEWLGMGQLNTPGYAHGRMNQLDLCGTGGIAPFYLCMSRGLDVLLAHEHADKERVAVAGLSGGGWQTIFISSLDTRVKLANPVAGYSSFLTRLDHHKDLGDSEQTPCDLATVADYTHLTALMAPRATLLTYNSKDDCCFESGYALPPLLDAARPVFKLHGKEDRLRSHVNDDPGNHNFGKDNRQALYRMIGDHFFAGKKDYDWHEIPSDKEVKTKDALAIELPKDNADFNTLAVALAKSLPRDAELPQDKSGAEKWQKERRQRLRDLLRTRGPVSGEKRETTVQKGGFTATSYKYRLGQFRGFRGEQTIPVVQLEVKDKPPTAISLLFGDAGRVSLHEHAGRLLREGHRVYVMDPFYFGEAKVDQAAYLFALMVATVGERALGFQTKQVEAIARLANGVFPTKPGVQVVAVGPRCGVIALCAAALDPGNIASVTLHNPMGSLKEIIEQNRSFEQSPELFCFGLLEQFDVQQLAALVAPRPLRIVGASERVKKELAGLKKWYALLGQDFDPLASK